jgi:hypothetical protein
MQQGPNVNSINYQGMGQQNINQGDIDPSFIHHLDPVRNENQQFGNQQLGGRYQNYINKNLYNLRFLNKRY